MVAFPPVLGANEIFIGAILPMSGTHAAFGHMQKNSMLMALEEINSRGGINGETLQLDIRDSGGRVRNARAVVEHFVKDKQYPVVLGGFSSKVAAALADICERKRTPLIVVTGSNDAITLQGYRYVFRVAPPRSRYPQTAMDYARSRVDTSNIVLITEKSVYGDSMARTVSRVAREARWTVSGEWKYDIGSRNLQWLYTGAAAARPEIIFLAAFPPEASRIIKELTGKIPKAVIFNLTPASTQAGSYTQCGSACEGVMHPSLWLPDLEPAAARFRDKYLDTFGSEPDYHGAQAYASVITAAQAIRRSSAAQAGPVRDALEGITASTPYGKVSFRQWGGFDNQNDPANYLVRWTGVEFELVWPK